MRVSQKSQLPPEGQVRLTVNVPRPLLRKAKGKLALRGKTLTQEVNKCLEKIAKD